MAQRDVQIPIVAILKRFVDVLLLTYRQHLQKEETLKRIFADLVGRAALLSIEPGVLDIETAANGGSPPIRLNCHT